MGDFYRTQWNGPANAVNNATKPLRAAGLPVPKVPTFDMQSEYFRERQPALEGATTIAGDVLLGGAGRVGAALGALGAMTGLAEGAGGRDLETGEELSPAGRFVSAAGGVLGGAAASRTVIGTADEAAAAIRSGMRRPPSSAAEAVTPEGARLAVLEQAPRVSDPLESRAVNQTGGWRDVGMHEESVANPVGGHTIRKHVGLSETRLRQRLADEPDKDFVSSFRNEQVANRVQGQFVKQHRAEIEAWLQSGSSGTFKREVTMSDPVGIVVERGKSGVVETNHARVVIARDNSAHGWYIVTSFPVIEW